MNLQQILTEQQFYTDKNQIKRWLDEYEISKYLINPDHTVSVDNRVDIKNCNLKSIPVKFKHIYGDFNCSNNQLTDLSWAPDITEGNFDCSYNQLTSMAGVPRTVEYTIFCNVNPFHTFKNIHKMTTCKRVLLPMSPIKGVLCWLLVPNIVQVACGHNDVAIILNKHLNTTDILSVQEELIDAGLGEWAKL